jgi:hypothetical protein
VSFPWVVTIKREIITALNVTPSLFFSILPEHIDAFVPYWHEFKNSVAVEISLLHSQPFTNIHLHFSSLWSRRPPKCCFRSPDKLKCDGARSRLYEYRTVGLWDCSIWLTVAPFVALPLQSDNTYRKNAWLTLKLQAREPYTLNVPRLYLHKFWCVSTRDFRRRSNWL